MTSSSSNSKVEFDIVQALNEMSLQTINNNSKAEFDIVQALNEMSLQTINNKQLCDHVIYTKNIQGIKSMCSYIHTNYNLNFLSYGDYLSIKNQNYIFEINILCLLLMQENSVSRTCYEEYLTLFRRMYERIVQLCEN